MKETAGAMGKQVLAAGVVCYAEAGEELGID